MQSFVLGDSDFGIDRSQSWVRRADGMLSAKVYADEERFDALTEAEDSPFSWALYPPNLYLMELPLVGTDESAFAVSPECEAALYMMEHNELLGVTGKVAEAQLTLSGSVDVLGVVHPLKVVYSWAENA